MTEQSPAANESISPHVVVLIHGIRDRALWQAGIATVLKANGLTPVSTSYGYFDLFRFLFPVPFFRNWAIRELTRQFDQVLEDHPGKKISVIAHSFGTYVFARLLQTTRRLRVHQVIFCGSVLRYDFPFEQFVDRFTPPILNEVGTRDIWPALGESVTWGYGSAGTFGFVRPRIQDRWHSGATHGYFFRPDFCQKYWVPFLNGGKIVPGAMPPEEPSWWVKFITLFKVRYLLIAVLAACTLYFMCTFSAKYSGPNIVLIDNRLGGVYSRETEAEGGTNNSDIADALERGALKTEVRPNIYGVLVYPKWMSDSQILALNPDIIVVHANAFKALPPDNSADKRLAEFLGNVVPGTDIVLYSRGFVVGSEDSSKTDLVERWKLQSKHLHILALDERSGSSFRDTANAIRLRDTISRVLKERGRKRAGAPWCCNVF